MSTSVDKTTLLIFGYISTIKSLFDDNTIIPQEIYQLCILFYQINGRLILWSKQIYTMGKFVFGIFDTHNGENFIVNTTKFPEMNDNKNRPSNPCHFTNFRFKQQTLNGIFTLILKTKLYRQFCKFLQLAYFLCVLSPDYLKSTLLVKTSEN